MNRTNHETAAITCGALLSEYGMSSSLFISCLPDGTNKVIPALLTKGLLDGQHEGIIMRGAKWDESNLMIDVYAGIIFMAHLLDKMKNRDVENDCDFLTVCHVFFNGSRILAGLNDETDQILSFLFASLVSLLGDDPIFHLIGPNTVKAERREAVLVLLQAEITLSYNLLDRAFASDGTLKIKILKFVHTSWKLIIDISSELSPETNNLEEYRELYNSTGKAIQKAERILALERKLQHLEKLRNGEVM